MSVEHYSRPDCVDVPRSFQSKGRFYRFTDEQWAKITDMVKVPLSVEMVTLMRGSRTSIQVNKTASELIKKSPC